MTISGEQASEQGFRPSVYDSYARLSRMPDTGELEKIETQLADNRTVIERYGGVLGKELSDGLSAWRKGVRRPGWQELLERVRSGASDGIVVWHTDRLFRQPRDLELLIELGEKGFRVTSAHGQRDLADPDDRFILRIEVAHAARSSDDTQRRTKRRNAARRRSGIRHVAGRAFGWPGKDRSVPADDNGNRPYVSAERVAAERDAIREGCDAVLAGVFQTVIAERWNEAGLTGVTGSIWTGVAVRDVLNRASNAGLIEHDGEIVSEIQDGTEPIVSRAVWERVRALHLSRSRGRAPGLAYLGTGLLRCGECGQKLNGRTLSTRSIHSDGQPHRQYYCPTQRRGCGSVSASTRGVDQELRTFVMARLSDARYAEAIAAARAETSDRLHEVEREIGECERLQEDLAGKLGRRELTARAFQAANTPLAEDLGRLYTERDTLTDANPRGPGQARPADEIAEQWDQADLADQRAMLTQALGDRTMIIDRATYNPGRRGFDPVRVRLAETS